ncbi:MAG: DNA mismatch repair endonuclease MutL [Chloroflexota bacterium]|nr:DNA mismatch repair endonuclease MutL [Chloroflexota bacterium]
MPIRVLPPEVAAKIAAGEVVERPASVVKELVENALDAGAQSLHIEAAEGGRRLIRVLDDGCGVPSDEVELAFSRYSTSKLSRAADLERIRTLGFRGEALASIAAVSQVTLITRTPDEELGTLIRLEGGEVVRREGKGHPQGTAVTVENLFYNTPARRKFLRTASTERRHISALVTRYAMAYPEVRFTLIHDGRITFQTSGRGDLREVCINAYGLDVARELLALEEGGEGPITVSGLISPPSIHRATRDHLSFFVNRRWVQSRMLAYALEEAYHTLLPSGRHPIAVVELTLASTLLDVNVHPTKREVHFRDSSAAFRAVQRRVRSTLMKKSPIPGVKPSQQVESGRWKAVRGADLGGAQQLPLTAERSEDRRGLPPLRVIGQVGEAYIIAEGPEGVYLIDQHAAHERVLYEQLRDQQGDSDLVKQGLLSAQAVELTGEQKSTLEEYAEQLAGLGFELEPFGGQTVLIRALPVPLHDSNPARLLIRVLDDLATELKPLSGEKEARLITTVCKGGAIKAGQTLSTEEMRELIHQLEQTEMPRTCPHGRPTMIHLSQTQLEREFGRR